MVRLADAALDDKLRKQAEVALHIMGDFERDVAVLYNVGGLVGGTLRLWCATELGVHRMTAETVPASLEVGALSTHTFTRWRDLGPVTIDILFASVDDVEPAVHVQVPDLELDLETKLGSDEIGLLAFARECADRRG